MLRKFNCVCSIIFFLICFLIFTLIKNLSSVDYKTRGKEFLSDVRKSNGEIHQTMVNLEEENRKRIFRVQNVCKIYNLGCYKNHDYQTNQVFKYPPTPQYSVFYIDQINKISYCPIYKAGSTTWLHNMCLLMNVSESVLTNEKEQISSIARKVIPELDFPEAEKAMLATTKLLIVRHPFERLLSAYRDKLENSIAGREHGTLHFYRKYGRTIVKKYRDKNFTPPTENEFIRKENEPKPAGIEPTWKEFVNYLIDINLENYADDHWIPYYLYCTPCSLNYTFIAKVESLDRDQSFIINKLILNNKIRPIHRHQVSLNDKSNPSKIYFRQLTQQQISQLYNKYKLDFEMFDYSAEIYYSYASDFFQYNDY
ncbi:carbohydrate sulfotransferase 11 isoform X1 [Microplitis demolitor]|uniref:carbohydrate sulfotransferase 11 isoform X1 n=1 Tax=Microplitis demolitor TaxID=69319 RepID=UPI0004CCE8E3|nr:carbohydrate sulfotransferase 11 isoform X1 [Microplitis demolitor]